MYREDFAAGITSGNFALDPNDPINRGLVGCWPMNEGRGKTVRDLTRFQNHFTPAVSTGFLWGPDKDGSDLAASYGGVGGSTANHTADAQFSYSFWFNLFTVSGGGFHYFLFENVGSLPIYRNVGHNGTSLFVYNGGVGLPITCPLNSGWHHAVLTFDGTSATLYLDARASSSGAATPGTGGNLGFGVFALGTGFTCATRVYNRAITSAEVRRLKNDQFAGLVVPEAPSHEDAYRAATAIGAAITGTATASITEADIVTGGKTIIITLTGDTWQVAAGGLFDAQRQNIIDGIDSAQAEANGWDATVKATQGVAGVVRTSDTVVTITLDAQATYDITAQETITVTVPSSALFLGLGALVGAPTFTVATVSAGSILRYPGMSGGMGAHGGYPGHPGYSGGLH